MYSCRNLDQLPFLLAFLSACPLYCKKTIEYICLEHTLGTPSYDPHSIHVVIEVKH